MTAELAALITRHTDADRLYPTSVPGLQLMRWSTPSSPIYVSQPPCVALLVQGGKSLTVGGDELHYGPGQYLLTSIDMPVSSRITEASRARPVLGIAVEITGEGLRSITRHAPDLAPDETRPGIAVHRAEPELVDALVRLARLLDRPQHAVALAPVIQQEILYWLLVGPSGGRLLQIARRDSPSNRVTRAITLLREQFAAPLRVETLAREAGMSTSSFHSHFKTLCNTTPLQFQKQLRLHEARRLILAEDMDIGGAAFAVGYESPSHFGRDYLRYFGRTPRADHAAWAGTSLTAYAPA